MSEGRGFVDNTGRPTAFDSPGYPMALTGTIRLVGDPTIANALVQMGAAAAICALVSWLGGQLYGVRVGRCAALLAALYPNHVAYVSLFLSEPVFTALVIAALALLLASLRDGGAAVAASGIALGFASLARPTMQLFPVFVLPWLRWQGRSWRSAASRVVLLVGFGALGVLPWLVRNRVAFGEWTLSAAGGQNFWAGNYPGAFGGYVWPSWVDAAIFDGAEYSSSEAYRQGLRAIAAAPLLAVVRGAAKLSFFFGPETDGVMWNLKGIRGGASDLATVALVGAANLVYGVTVVLALLAVCARWRSPAFTSLVIIVTAYLGLVSMVFVSDPRYHFPLVPLAAVLAAEGFVNVLPVLRDGLGSGSSQARVQLRSWLLLSLLFGVLVVGNLVVKYCEISALGAR